ATSDRGIRQINTMLNQTGKLMSGLRPMVRDFTDAFLTLGSEGSKHFGMLRGMLNRWAADFNAMIQRISNNGVLEGSLAGLDRKSTRLNSSHVKISYAVFCLKKKLHYSAVRTHLLSFSRSQAS